MLIVCPSCATSYDVEPASLQPNGRRVRCVRCRNVWRAGLTHAAKLTAAAEALAPDRPRVEVPIAAGAEAGGTAGATHAVRHDARVSPHDENSPVAPIEVAAGAWTVASSIEPNQAIEVEAPPIAPAARDAAQPSVDIAAAPAATDTDSRAADVETLAARRYRRDVKRRRPLWSLSRLQTATLILLVVDSVLIGWRKDIVRVLPQTASLYAAIGLAVNLRGVSFDDVATHSENDGGIPILVVQGNIVNDSGEAVGLPRLKLILRNAAQREIYSWTTAPPRPTLSPHEAIGFRTRLASPPADGRDVLVRFVNHGDRIADTY